MIRRPPRSTLSSSSAASDVYKRQSWHYFCDCTRKQVGCCAVPSARILRRLKSCCYCCSHPWWAIVGCVSFRFSDFVDLRLRAHLQSALLPFTGLVFDGKISLELRMAIEELQRWFGYRCPAETEMASSGPYPPIVAPLTASLEGWTKNKTTFMLDSHNRYLKMNW